MNEKIKLEKHTRYEQAKQAITNDVSNILFSNADAIGESTITIKRQDVAKIVEMTMGQMLLDDLVSEEVRKEVK